MMCKGLWNYCLGVVFALGAFVLVAVDVHSEPIIYEGTDTQFDWWTEEVTNEG